VWWKAYEDEQAKSIIKGKFQTAEMLTAERVEEERKMTKTVLHRLTTVLILLAAVTGACGAPAATPAPTELAGPVATPTTGEVATATPEPAVPVEPKVLRLRQAQAPQNMDPALHVGGMDVEVMSTMMQGLVAFKPGTWEVYNLLAESIEGSEDGLQIDFKLREGVQFQGGYGELTAEDVKFSFERYLDEELASPYKDDWASLDHVEVTGKYTGSIIMKEPFAPLLHAGLSMPTGWIISEAAIGDRGLEEFGLNPIGTGPYEMLEFTPGEKLVVRRFEDYWGEPPEWDEIEFVTIVDDSTAEIALESGEVDFGRISPRARERFEADNNLEVVGLTLLDHYGVAMNVQHPKLQDINIRMAIRAAIDAPSIIEAAWEGAAVRACNMFSPSSVGYWADAPCHDRDLEEARGYMAQAGVESLDLTFTSDNSEAARVVGEVVQANLAEIGINVEIIPLDFVAYMEGGFGDKGLQERQLTWIPFSTPSPDPYWPIGCCFTCKQVGQWNYAYWCNEEFDQLYYEALKEMDPDKRAEMYHDMVQIWDDDVAIAWIAHPTAYYVGRADLVPAQQPNGFTIPHAFRSK
jgi:peptide/nickel transport system substrate-binding protein